MTRYALIAVLLVVPLAVASGQQSASNTRAHRSRAPSRNPEVTVVGGAYYWLISDKPSADSAMRGSLYFAQLIENSSKSGLWVDYAIRSYHADGTPGPSCGSSFNDYSSPDVVLPRARTLLTCRADYKFTLADSLSLTARIEVRGLLPVPDTTLGMTSLRVLRDSAHRFDQTQYLYRTEGLATPPKRDRRIQVVFFLADSAGDLITTCSSAEILLQPEVQQRVHCGPKIVAAGQSQPSYATALILRPLEWPW